MTVRIRPAVLVAGATALISAQAAYASVDPLVSLSVFGTAQSRAAVCAGAAAATAAAYQSGTVATGCVLPITAPVAAPPPPASVVPLAAEPMVHSGLGIGTIPLLLGLAAIAGVAALILSHHHHHNNNPISPA